MQGGVYHLHRWSRTVLASNVGFFSAVTRPTAIRWLDVAAHDV